MPIKDIGKKLNESLQNTVKTVREKAENIELPDFKELGDKASEQVKAVFQKKPKPDIAEPSERPGTAAISGRNALKVIYFLMAADGEISREEEEKIDEIGKELMADYDEARDSIMEECRSDMDNMIDPEDHYDVIQDCVENALRAPASSGEGAVTPKLLLWDLLTVAYSDENYHETERKLLKYVARKLSVDKAVFLEMESSILTLMDIEKELSWIKTTNRPYLKIEETVRELNNRKDIIFDSVKDLITL